MVLERRKETKDPHLNIDDDDDDEEEEEEEEVDSSIGNNNNNNNNNKHQALDALVRSVSRVTVARTNASLVFQLFSFLVVCSGMISKGFGFVTFFASLKASSVCIHLSCLVCL